MAACTNKGVSVARDYICIFRFGQLQTSTFLPSMPNMRAFARSVFAGKLTSSTRNAGDT